MKSAGKGSVVQRLQMLHVHVLLVAPLRPCNVPQPGAEQHQRRVPVRETAHHARPAPDLTVQPFNGVVGADSRPVLRREVAVGQRFLNAVLHLLGGFLELHCPQLCNNSFGLLTCGFLALLRVDRLEHFGDELHLGLGYHAENIAVEVDDAA